jgi:hypothetical protein
LILQLISKNQKIREFIERFNWDLR